MAGPEPQAHDLHAEPILAEPVLGESARALRFDDFYDANAGRIGAALELTLQHPELAEDALNEAMTRAFQRWKQVSGYTNPSGWVYRVGMNWARSWLRGRRRERARVARVGTRPLETSTTIEPALAAALHQLPVDRRAVIVCRFHLELSTSETADALGIAEGTVKSRLSRGLDELRTALGVDRGEA